MIGNSVGIRITEIERAILLCCSLTHLHTHALASGSFLLSMHDQRLVSISCFRSTLTSPFRLKPAFLGELLR